MAGAKGSNPEAAPHKRKDRATVTDQLTLDYAERFYPGPVVPRCIRCGSTDSTVAPTVTRSGAVWPCHCSDCLAHVMRLARGFLRAHEGQVPA